MRSHSLERDRKREKVAQGKVFQTRAARRSLQLISSSARFSTGVDRTAFARCTQRRRSLAHRSPLEEIKLRRRLTGGASSPRKTRVVTTLRVHERCRVVSVEKTRSSATPAAAAAAAAAVAAAAAAVAAAVTTASYERRLFETVTERQLRSR